MPRPATPERRWRTRWRVALVLATCLMAPLARPTLAAEPSLREVPITSPPGQLGALLAPVPVILTDPAQPRGTMRLDNVSTEEESFAISVTDYVVTADGEPVPAPDGYPFGSASWYRFEPSSFTLPPGTSRDVTVEVDPPLDAAAGDHLAAVTVTVRASVVAPGADLESVLVLQNRLQHRIPGADPRTPRLQLNAEPGMTAVAFTGLVQNDGNTVLAHQSEPLAHVELTSTLLWANGGAPERSLPIEGFYVGPGADRTVRLTWHDPPIIGAYRAEFILPAADGLPRVSASVEFVVVNLLLLAGLFIVVGAALGVVVWRRFRI